MSTTTTTATPELADWERAHIIAGLKSDARREVGSIEVRATLSRLKLEEDAAGSTLAGPSAGLAYMAEAEQYRLMADWLEGIAVTLARLQGESWEAIGRSAAPRRISRQAAQARWAPTVRHTIAREVNVIRGLSDANRGALERAFRTGQLD